MADAIVYVDGFNLYCGSLKRTPYKWLDLGRLCTGMLPNDRVIAIKRASTKGRDVSGQDGPELCAALGRAKAPLAAAAAPPHGANSAP